MSNTKPTPEEVLAYGLVLRPFYELLKGLPKGTEILAVVFGTPSGADPDDYDINLGTPLSATEAKRLITSVLESLESK